MLAASDLSGINLGTEHRLLGTRDERPIEAPEPLAPGMPLTKLVQLGISQEHFAPEILDLTLAELAKQSVRPVLIALDGAQNLFRPTGMKDGSFREIDSFVLNVSRALIRLARGSQRLVGFELIGMMSTWTMEILSLICCATE